MILPIYKDNLSFDFKIEGDQKQWQILAKDMGNDGEEPKVRVRSEFKLIAEKSIGSEKMSALV